jgi:hypothetical protein
MNNIIKILVFCAMAVPSTGCAYRHYLGFHGPSVKAFQEIHQGITEDQNCLTCHAPNQAFNAPPTSHPRFTGCLKCHNS